jgi:hypothetical protein
VGLLPGGLLNILVYHVAALAALLETADAIWVAKDGCGVLVELRQRAGG